MLTSHNQVKEFELLIGIFFLVRFEVIHVLIVLINRIGVKILWFLQMVP